MRSHILAGVLALLLPACIVGTGEISGTGDDGTGGTGGGGGGGGGDGTGGGTGGGNGSGSGATNTPRIESTIDKATLATQLGKTEVLNVTVMSMNGFAGAVNVTPTLLNGTTAVNGWTMTANPTTVNLTAGGSASVQVSVKIPTDAAALTPDLKIDLAGGTATASVDSALTIAKILEVDIDAGTGTGSPHTKLPSPNSPIRVRSGTQLVFHNADNIQHVIHGDGGIPHENTGLGGAGTDYKVTVTNDATWYCHNHEGSGQARPVLIVQ